MAFRSNWLPAITWPSPGCGSKLTEAQIQSFVYLKLAVAGHLTLLVARARRAFLTKPYPAPILLIAILASQAAAALTVGFGFPA